MRCFGPSERSGSGEAIFSPAIAQRLIEYFAMPRPAASGPPFPELTDREREILILIAQRRANPEIARDLGINLKTVVYGVGVAGAAKAYPADALRQDRAIEDVVGHHRIVIREDAGGRVTAVDRTDGRTILPLRTFWFAWAAFHPNTDLFGSASSRPTPAQGVFPGPTCRLSRARLRLQVP
jgi:hypothetical protein